MAFAAVQKHPRYRTSILVRVMDPTTSQVQVRSLANISTGGVFVCTPEVLPIGTPLHLILHPPGSPVGVTGRVVHVMDKGLADRKGHPIGYGIEFDGLTDVASAGVKSYVEVLARDSRAIPTSLPANFSTEQPAVRAFRATPRFLDRTQVRLTVSAREDLKELWLTNLSKGGLFVESPSPPPRGTRVTVELETPGGMLKLFAEVVHVVDAESARTLGMPSGAGLEFVELQKGQRDALHAYIEGRAPSLQVQSEPIARNATASNVMAAVASFFAGVESQDPHSALQLRKDAGDAEIAARVEQLRTLFSTPPDDASAAQAARIAAAARTLQRVESHLRRPVKAAVVVDSSSAAARHGVAPDKAAQIQKLLVEARDHEAASRFLEAREALVRLHDLAPAHPGVVDRMASLKEKADVQAATELLAAGEEHAEKPDHAPEVIRCVRKALELSHARHIHIRGMHLLMRIRFHDDAKPIARALVQRYPDEQAGWAVLLHIHEKAAEWADALEAGEELMLLRPKDKQLKDQLDAIRPRVRKR